MFCFDAIACLTKRERKGLNAGIEEVNLESAVFDLTLLPDELIETWLPDLAVAIGGGITSAIRSGRGAVQFHPEANGFTILCRTYYHVQVASMEPEHDFARGYLKHSALGAHVPRSTQSPLIQSRSYRWAIRP